MGWASCDPRTSGGGRCGSTPVRKPESASDALRSGQSRGSGISVRHGPGRFGGRIVSHMRARAGAASAPATAWRFGRMPRSRVESGGECVSAKVGESRYLLPRHSADRRSRSRGAAHGGEGQMPASVLVAHRQLKPDAGLSLDQHLRPGTPGRSRPKGTRLETRTSIRRPLVEVDLVGCPALQGGMRPSFVVPGDEPRQVPVERSWRAATPPGAFACIRSSPSG